MNDTLGGESIYDLIPEGQAGSQSFQIVFNNKLKQIMLRRKK